MTRDDYLMLRSLQNTNHAKRKYGNLIKKSLYVAVAMSLGQKIVVRITIKQAFEGGGGGLKLCAHLKRWSSISLPGKKSTP